MSGSGTGTPITVAADAYVATSEAGVYFSGDPRATAFLALGAGMAWYLQRATKIIDSLPLKGRTYYEFVTGTPGADEQNKQFPRVIDGVAYGWVEDTALPEVPQEVEDACCEEALALYLFYADSDRTDRKTMAEDGVQNYNLGGVYSEALGKSHQDKHGLMSSEARRLLAGYVGGAFQMVL